MLKFQAVRSDLAGEGGGAICRIVEGYVPLALWQTDPVTEAVRKPEITPFPGVNDVPFEIFYIKYTLSELLGSKV